MFAKNVVPLQCSKEILFVFAGTSPSPSEGTGASLRGSRLFTEPMKASETQKQGVILSGMCNLRVPFTYYILKSLKTTAKTTDNSGIILTFVAAIKNYKR